MTERRDARRQPGRGSGQARCPRCGAPNYITDATCLSCGADLDALRAHPAPPRAELKPARLPARGLAAIPPPGLPLSVLRLRGWSVACTAAGSVRMVPSLGWRLLHRLDRFAGGLLALLFGGFECVGPAWVTDSPSEIPFLPPWVFRAIGLLLVLWAGRELASFCVEEEWEAGPNRLEVRRALFRRRWEASYTSARLEMRKRTHFSFWYESEETSYDLVVTDGSGQTAVLTTARFFPADVSALGRFLAEVTGWAFTELPWL